MSHQIDLRTAEMIKVTLQQHVANSRGLPEESGLRFALEVVQSFCAIPLADAAIARARGSLFDTRGLRIRGRDGRAGP